MVGITICIVIRLQESVVACVLQPWSGGKDPDRYRGSPSIHLCVTPTWVRTRDDAWNVSAHEYVYTYENFVLYRNE
jgi:hypothetical protein